MEFFVEPIASCHVGRCNMEWGKVINPQQNGPEPAPVVLVVEDEVLIRLATSDDLRDDGFQVVEAANADEALKFLRSRRVDAMVTDVRMPGSMDGLELVGVVRKEMPWVAIFIASGHVSAESKLPDVKIVQKPYDSRIVSRMIRQALENWPK